MNGEPPPPTNQIVVSPHGVVTRRSTDLLAVTDPDVSAALRFIRDNAGRAIEVRDVLTRVPAAAHTRTRLSRSGRANDSRRDHARAHRPGQASTGKYGCIDVRSDPKRVGSNMRRNSAISSSENAACRPPSSVERTAFRRIVGTNK